MTEENFIISSDSTCDLYSDYVAEHGIRIVPLHYTMEENGVLTEGVDAFTEYAQYIGFYGKLRAGGRNEFAGVLQLRARFVVAL